MPHHSPYPHSLALSSALSPYHMRTHPAHSSPSGCLCSSLYTRIHQSSLPSAPQAYLSSSMATIQQQEPPCPAQASLSYRFADPHTSLLTHHLRAPPPVPATLYNAPHTWLSNQLQAPRPYQTHEYPCRTHKHQYPGTSPSIPMPLSPCTRSMPLSISRSPGISNPRIL